MKTVIEMAREANIKQAIETPHLLMVNELNALPSLSVLTSVRRVRKCVIGWRNAHRTYAAQHLSQRQRTSEQGGTHDSNTIRTSH